MRGLRDFENRLEQAISGMFARAFRSAVQPVEIAAELQREVDTSAQVLSRDRRLAPNEFHVELSRTDLERLSPYDSTMARELAEQLEQHAQRQAYVFPGPVSISFEAADDLGTGRLRVRSRPVASVQGNAESTQVRRTARVMLEINGTRHHLVPPGVVIGRGTDADIRINDPGVSRRHVEFSVSEGLPEEGSPLHVGVRDLGSTNGMFVDGHRASAVGLHDGSRVHVGNTDIVVRVVEDEDRGAPGV
ncbi:MAG TPA: DUF3662 and FHA domain-containing protein [Nocardioides sp.]|uniref:DUF3662 and FHA domain-containing protein n=1 Tax=Nocardioides sp. TaxID=35761 RepID=UPI002B8AC1E1|nr:DUF3662 and FHA domain-containing protein [Nocardioides sp.]HQR26807.1 DUF3662 and FHA domain-containing protein [Nocardioides sp.]